MTRVDPGPAAPAATSAAVPEEVAAAAAEDRRTWLTPLRATGRDHDDALARLHALLFRAALFEVTRRRPALPHLRAEELHDIALQASDDALMGVLRRLGDFRGASRFTTWAYKFALLEAAAAMRRRAWQGREVPLTDAGWSLVSDGAPGPGERAEQAELVRAVRLAIDSVLTPHQRHVLVALAVEEVPIDVLADRLGTTRGALYKTMHDGRRKLRAHLRDRGLLGDGGGRDG